MSLSLEKTQIEGLVLICPHLFEDERGYFLKDFECSFFRHSGLPVDFYETSESKSKKGTIRGLHFQYDFWQGLYIRAITGAFFVVAVDLRRTSKTFGQWQGFELTERNHNVLFIPEGFAHGYLVIEDNGIISFKSTNKYAPESESGIRFDDPDIGIQWPVDKIGGWNHVIVSSKDSCLQSFSEYAVNE